MNKDICMFLKALTSMTTPEVMKLIKSECPYVIFRSDACEMLKKKTSLDKMAVIYSITPDFPWGKE